MKIRYRVLQTAGIICSLLTLPATAADLAGEVAGFEENQMEMAQNVPHEGFSLAEGGPGEHHKGGGFNLTDDQLEKIHAIKLSAMESTAAKKAQLHVLHAQLRDLMTRPSVDKKQVLDIQSKINGLQGDLAISRVSARVDMMAVLTPEQRGKIRHHMLMHEVMSGFGHHHGRGGHGGGMHGRGHHGWGGGHHEGGGPGGHHEHGAGTQHESTEVAPPAEDNG